MYLSKIKIKGYKVFKEEFTANFNPGMNIIVGENGSGKSAVIDAVRLILFEDEYGRSGISSSDFHRSIAEVTNSRGSKKIQIRTEFENLNDDEQVAYLPWLDLANPSKSILNLSIDNKEDGRGKFQKKVWGNESESGLFEWELLNRIACIYLPPLRDAEDKLRAYKGSRLARLLKNLRPPSETNGMHPLEKKFAAFNKDLLRDESIKAANKAIQENLVKSVGKAFGQDASIQFSEINFDRIVERLRLLFYPLLPQAGTETGLNMFRGLEENSLGFNNILYLATVLAELEGLDDVNISHKILLIEEPEAHLHPQLQIRLLQYLSKKADDDQIQIIVTTHSPTLAASIDLNALKVITVKKPGETPVFTSISKCGIDIETKFFLERWLDITKSILLFAKGVILVEGIAEALVLRELARYVLRKLAADDPDRIFLDDLEEYGISIVNLNGIYFRHFMTLFQGYRKSNGSFITTDFIPVWCAGLTDNDPAATAMPTAPSPAVGTNSQLYMINDLKSNSTNCRLFSNLKTFEYDLAMEGNNLSVMADVQLSFITTDGSIKKKLNQIIATNWPAESENDKAKVAAWLLNHIEKGEFAQGLAQRLSKSKTVFSVPSYIIDAIKWVIQG
jgi:putative ATP-dependent endonuclease of OLD family